jgi:hypothetical protein
MQILLKQSPTAVDNLQNVFYLTEGEKQFLLSAGVGEGLFFAGANHVAIQVVASENVYNLISTNPNDAVQVKEQLAIQNPESEQQPVPGLPPQPAPNTPQLGAEGGIGIAAPPSQADYTGSQLPPQQ